MEHVTLTNRAVSPFCSSAPCPRTPLVPGTWASGRGDNILLVSHDERLSDQETTVRSIDHSVHAKMHMSALSFEGYRTYRHSHGDRTSKLNLSLAEIALAMPDSSLICNAV